MSARTRDELDIRRLRKKLRQIENLESKERDLTDEELAKVIKKQSLREKLLELLAQREDPEDVAASVNSENNSSFENSMEIQSSKIEISNIEVTLISHEDVEETELVNVEDDWVPDHNEEITLDIRRSNFSERSQPSKNNSNADKSFEVSPREPIHKEANFQSSITKELAKDSGKSTNVSEISQKKKKKGASQTTENKPLSVSQQWRTTVFSVYELEGHNDLITATDIKDSMLVTSSRDTTIKMWDLDERREIRSYGGHTGSVTAVLLLTRDAAKQFGSFLGEEEDDFYILSGSTDCSLKIWSAQKGHVMRSIYTYNPVTNLVYHPVAQAVITSSDGGKIDVWRVENSDNIQSITAFEDCVTGLQVHNNTVYACCSIGTIKVFDTRGSELVCVFKSENIKIEGGGLLTERLIRGFYACENLVYFGDDGVNIKVLNWKTGMVHKLSNHSGNFGITDSICSHGNLLFSSAYDLDNGLGFVNVRDFKEETYFVSLNDMDTKRIMSLSCATQPSGGIALVTAGLELKVWSQVTDSKKNKDDYLVRGTYNACLSRNASDSDVESDVDSSQSEEEEDDQTDHSYQGSHVNDEMLGKGWLSWCNII